MTPQQPPTGMMEWMPIDSAPEWDGKTGPFIDVTWAGVAHRYLPVPRRETDCFCENGLIMRKHGYPSVLTIFDPQPTHWMPLPPEPGK
jgi:hypothetical protein